MAGACRLCAYPRNAPPLWMNSSLQAPTVSTCPCTPVTGTIPGAPRTRKPWFAPCSAGVRSPENGVLPLSRGPPAMNRSPIPSSSWTALAWWRGGPPCEQSAPAHLGYGPAHLRSGSRRGPAGAHPACRSTSVAARAAGRRGSNGTTTWRPNPPGAPSWPGRHIPRCHEPRGCGSTRSASCVAGGSASARIQVAEGCSARNSARGPAGRELCIVCEAGIYSDAKCRPSGGAAQRRYVMSSRVEAPGRDTGRDTGPSWLLNRWV